MRLTPLGAGNCQFVYRIDHEPWTSQESSTGPWSHCSVLKITRKADCSMLMRRMLYHDEFCLFMQEGSCHNNNNNNETCSPKRICCIIDRHVAKQLRTHLSKLLENKQKYHFPGYAGAHRASVDSSLKGKVFHNEVVYKKRIYHVKEVALQTSLHVNPRCIRIFSGEEHVYDPQKHELAILEEDMFNLAVCGALGRTLMKSRMQKYRNISVELKPKCGLLNFSGMPSLFQMSQPYKSRIRYQNIISTVVELSDNTKDHEVTHNVGLSRFSPIKFFGMRLENVKKELLHLARAPQNNMRIFVDNIEVDPRLLSHDRNAMEAVSKCLVENRAIVGKILKVQALASGQQIVAHMVYYLSRVVARMDGIRNIDSYVGGQFKFNVSSIFLNLLYTSRDFLRLILCDCAHPYEIQRFFNMIGRRLICMLCRVLAIILDTTGMTFYTTRTNLSVDRIAFSGNKQCCRTTSPIYIARRELAVHSQGQLFSCDMRNDGAVQLVMYDKLERLVKTIETSCYHKSKSKCSKTLKEGQNKNVGKYTRRQQLSHVLSSCNRWIELYLGGRTAMDLSIVLNVLFQDAQEDGEKGPNFFRFSLIDLDLKPARRIPRWKEDVLFLIREHGFK